MLLQACPLFWAECYMTAGRLIFACGSEGKWEQPRNGRSMKLFGGIGTAMFCAGCILGEGGVWILGASGFALAILYPTMVLPDPAGFTRPAWLPAQVLLSVRLQWQILFNMLFGAVSSRWAMVSVYDTPQLWLFLWYLYLKFAGILKQN